MKFGALPPREAEGAIAVHSIRKGGFTLKKGTRIGAKEMAALEAANVPEIVVARLEPGDVGEDVAAADIAAAVAGQGVIVDRAFTGRANLFAEQAGVLVVDKAGIDALNDVDPSITFATLEAYAPVVTGKMISTLLPGLADKVIEKTIRVTEERLAPAGATIVAERRVPHETKALAKALDEVLKAGAEMVVVFGASAIADTRDVIPAAVEEVGGRIEHFGMPVDPGNLMLVAEANGRPVLGAPGCARSPKENGFDWILMRLLAGLPIRRSDITGLGVGGLLMEIVTRPQPRAEAAEAGRKIAGLVLAAGRSTRMGGPNKLLEEINGRPLVRIATEQLIASQAKPVIVVTGHQHERVERALSGLPVTFVHNADFADGLSTSLKAGINAVPAEADGAVVTLGDMPQVSAKLIDRLVTAFDPERGALVVVPTFDGKRGNPVLWSRRFFSDLMTIDGDVGARHLIGSYPEAVTEVPVEDAAALTDVDTPEALIAVRAAMDV
jgi:molybdenum cofactor cytidylyltransferase